MLADDANTETVFSVWRQLGLGQEKVVAELRMLTQHPTLDFEFTDGIKVPHLWTALRAITFEKVANRR